MNGFGYHIDGKSKKCSNTNTLVISLQQIRKQFICLQFVIILILLTTDVEERSAIFSQSSKRTANLHLLFIGNCHIRSGAADYLTAFFHSQKIIIPIEITKRIKHLSRWFHINTFVWDCIHVN